MGTFKKIFFSKKTIALGLVLVILLAVGLYFLINTLSNNFSQDPDMGLVLGSDSTMLQTPIDGTRPSDHDPKDNAYYALYKLNQLKSFKSYSEGETITHVAFASVSQKIKASRVVNNGEVYKESLSHSPFKGVGVRNYIKGENYVTLNASSVKSIDDVTWDTTAKKISKTDYVNLYGYVPSGITSYIFSEDTILNAEYLGEENGVFSYRYELDTVKSVAKLALEMRTMAGTASLPIFERAFVTIKMDKDWKVLSTTTDCTYKVDMLGGVTCNEAVTEIFTNHGEDVEIPNGDFFRSYVDDEIESVTPSEKTASDYLMAGFGDYIMGIKPLKVSLNIVSTDEKLPLSVEANAIININMNDLSNLSAFIEVEELVYDDFTFEDINVAYKNNDIYLKWKDIKAKANIDATITKLQSLLPLFGVELPTLDFGEIDTETLLSGATVTKDGTNVAVNLPLSLDDICLNATLNFTEDDTITFTGATAEIFGLDITLTPDESVTIDTTLSGYSDLLTVLDVIDDNGKINLDVSISNTTIQTQISLKPFAIDIKLGDITAKLSDNVVYLNYKDIKAKLALSDINGIIETLSPILSANGVTLPDLSAFNNLDVNSLLNEVISNIETTTTENGVVISTTVFGYDVAILLNNAEGKYTIDSISASIDSLNVVIEPTDTSFTAISDTTDYCDISTLLNIIDNNGAISLRVAIGNINALVKINLTNFDIDVFVDDLTIDGIKLGDITAKLSDNVVHLNYKDIKAKLALDSETINGILTKLSPIIGADNVNKVTNLFGSFDNIDVNSLLNEVISNIETTTTENGVVISTTVMDMPISILLNNANNEYTIGSISASIDSLNVVIEPTDTSFTAIDDLGNYANIASLLDMIDENNDVYFKLLFSEAEIIATLSLDDLVLTATYDGLKLYVDLKTLDVYLNYGDEAVLAKANLSDVDEILQKIKPILNKFMDVTSFDGLNVSAITSINVQDILNSITVNEMDNKLTVSLSINGVNVNAVFGTTDGLRLDELNVTMGEKFSISASIITKPDDYKIPEFDFNLEYSDAKALVEEFSGIIESILYTNSLNVKIGGSITSGDTVFTIVDSNITIAGLSSAPKANASIVLEQKNTVTGETFNHTVTLIYLDPSLVDEGAVNVYFTYDNSLDGDSKLEGTFTTTKASDTLAILKEIYKQMPDLQTSLEGILTPDENGYPTLPKFEFSVEELIKSISYKDGLLSGTLDTSVIMSSLPKQLGAEITRTENSLDVNIPNFDFGGTNVQLGVNVSVPDTTDVTDDTFSFDATNASDFSSIHLLLETLANTATNRSFHITGNIGAGIGELTIAPDAIKLDVKLDVDDNGLTFAKVVIERTHVELFFGAIQAWEDYDGVSTLYYDAENGLIHVEIMSRTKKTEKVQTGTIWGLPIYDEITTYPETYTYYTYTVEEYTANLMDRIFELLPLKSTWVDLINKETSKEDTNTTSTATIENTLKKYSYGANKEGEMTFTLNLDLAPLTKDVGLTNVYITHDNESMSLKGLTADTTIANILTINLSAEMKNQSKDLQGVKEEIASVKSLFPAPTKSN